MSKGEGLAGALKRLRERSGLSQGALAAESGASQSQVSAYELGKAEPGYSVLARLLAAMGSDFADLEDALREVRGEAPRNHHAPPARPWDAEVDAALLDQRIEWEVDRRLARMAAELARQMANPKAANGD